jgi:two-component system CheB/CheR fusion protein
MNAGPSESIPWYLSAMERLVSVVQDLSQARDLPAVTAIVREAARSLTAADGATFVLRDGDQCYYAEENAIAPLWKGKRFPLGACISGWVMLNARSAVIEDIYADPRIPADAYRPTFVKSLAMVPIRRISPIGAIGNYWASRHLSSPEEVAILQALADTTSVALENAELYTRLQRSVKTLREQQLRISEQHASLGVFTRALAHDLREPIRTLTSFSDLLLATAEGEGQQDTHLRYIGEAASRMGMLIDSVSQYTRLDSPEPPRRSLCRPSDIVADVRQNLARLIAERDATLICGSLPSLLADPVHLTQLVQNLVANAIVHNDSPVTVTIDYEIINGGRFFSISDNGMGIPEGKTEQIFQPFRRLVHRNDASGLGLAICQRIVALYGGEISCEPSNGGGATFLFTLPDAERWEPCAAFEEAVPAVANVVIVDDREADLELTQIALFDRPKLRCNLRTARDGREAHRLLKDAEASVDLVLLDINMPDIDGFELLERMRDDKALHDLPVIMCSGSDHEPDQRRSAELGAIGYLLKPPSFPSFKDIIAGQPRLRVVEDGSGITLIRTAA